jgi:hypothetical protein
MAVTMILHFHHLFSTFFLYTPSPSSAVRKGTKATVDKGLYLDVEKG